MNTVIQVDKLVKSFGDKTVLDGISLSIAEKKVTAIVGKSGVGKSVLLKCIAGLFKPTSGEITVNGICYHKKGNRIPERLSYLFQNNALLDSLTAYENVALPLTENLRMRPRQARNRVHDLFQQLDLDDSVLTRYPSELSGGMQKRLALARALALEPHIILFDEPTTGLDPERKNTVFEMIQRYQQRFGYTAVIVSHDIPEVFYIADHVFMVDKASIIFDGTPNELATTELPLAQSFLQNRTRLQHNLLHMHSQASVEEQLRRSPAGSMLYGINLPQYNSEGIPVREVTRFMWMRHTLEILRARCEKAVAWSPNEFELNLLTPPDCLTPEAVSYELRNRIPELAFYPPALEIYSLEAGEDCCDPSCLRKLTNQRPTRLEFSKTRAPFAL